MRRLKSSPASGIQGTVNRTTSPASMRPYRLTVNARAARDAAAATHAAASRARDEGTTAAMLPANGSISKMIRIDSSGMSVKRA